MCNETIQGFQIRFDPYCDLPLSMLVVKTGIKKESLETQ